LESIGDGGPRDNFGHEGSNRPQQLTRFLDYVSEQNGELIVVGDLLEFWQANFSKVIVASATQGPRGSASTRTRKRRCG
jgi:UDP-2,3-diacylglucosamine pyrophosphatase LpxH